LCKSTTAVSIPSRSEGGDGWSVWLNMDECMNAVVTRESADSGKYNKA